MLTHHDARSYEVAASEAATRARSIMESKIEEGAKTALRLVEHAHAACPTDAIVPALKLDFESREDGLRAAFGSGRDHRTYAIHNHALGQMAEKSGVPSAYLAALGNSPNRWRRDLASEILNQHFANLEQPNPRFLVRSVGEQVRGFLSDRYRRLDSRPLLDAFASACQGVGAIPVEGTITDLRLTLKAFLPMVFEPVPGEVMCLGVEWGNSDFGAAKHTLRAFIWRLWCTNHAVMEDSLAQVHLGGRLGEDIAFSQRTYDLDTRTSVSALKDVVASVLSPARVSTLLETIRAADEKKVEWKNVRTSLQKKLLKGELKAVEDAFASEDVINLPAGRSTWRVSNAISWIAGRTEDPTRRLELQRVAGEVVNGKADAAQEAA